MILCTVFEFDWQVAQQEAQRAQFVVERAKQERQQKVVQAEGEAQAAKMISFENVKRILHQHDVKNK